MTVVTGTPARSVRRGILFMLLTMAIFAVQDGLSTHLARQANPVFVVMIRYWAFMALVLALALRRPGGIAATARSARPALQIFRGVLLAFEVIITVWAFTMLGLAEAHAIFASCPLIVVALSGPLLGEAVGWRRWAAVGIGFAGILIILRPGTGVVSPGALVALFSAAVFALYGLLTRLAARQDSAATSFFWTGIAGGVFMTLIGPFFWSGLEGRDWILMAVLCVSGATGHFLLIKAYEASEASRLQPFAYFQLVFASAIGVFVFGERIDIWSVLGAAITVGAGLFVFWRESRRGRPSG